ncbi:MAG: ThiF family adenylyltransferase [Phycisphaerae bacterium]|jgi:adenylyltransferase/sulfurtransferase
MAISQAAQKIEQDPELARYSRQMLFEPVGEEGQRRLMESRVTLIGCGALGTVLANTLVRAGVGFLRVVDRDFIESNNLQRQVLFDEDDIAGNLPKAEAARRKLGRINSKVAVEAVVTDVNHRNIEQLGEGADLLLDGTDNFETRFLINDLAVKTRRPWVYGACIGATGLAMPILPNDTPCLRCVFESAPPPEMNPTCDTAGVLGPVVNIVASFQALEAMKILMGRTEAVVRRLLNFDAWDGRYSLLNVQKAYDQGDCPCCKQKRFEYLEGRFGSSATTLCGRNAVQITPPGGLKVDFRTIAEKMKAAAGAEPRFNAFMLKADVAPYEITVFADGRAIIKGTNKPDEAKSVYARYIGA